MLLDILTDLLQLPLTDEGHRMRLLQSLDEALDGIDTGGAGEEVQFVEILLGLLFVLSFGDEPYEDGFLGLGFSDDKLSHNLDKNTIMW